MSYRIRKTSINDKCYLEVMENGKWRTISTHNSLTEAQEEFEGISNKSLWDL